MTTDAPIRILFIEDSEIDVELAVHAMRQDGVDVRWRRVDSERGLKGALSAARPDAILSDFSMPQFDGLHALRLARDLAPDVPFIFLSGTIGEERAIEAIREGATDYVLKNNMRRLSTSVRRALAEAAEREKVRKAEEERARLVEILEATSDYVAMTDPEGRVIYMNSAWRVVAGVGAADVGARTLLDFHPPDAAGPLRDQVLPETERTGIWSGETSVRSADGPPVPVSQVVIAHRDPEGHVRFRSTIARDIRERKAYEARLTWLANYDALSGLPNRSLLADRARQAIAHAHRTARTCGIAVLNIDRFKLHNDSYGHGAGDALLRQLAERLPSAVRDGDTVARLGADTFAVLAADLARPDDVVNVARKVRECAAAPFSIEGNEVHLTLSVGASAFPRDGESFDLLLRNAEAAMHRAKADGGDAFQFYAAAMTRQASERIALENALRAAMAQRQLELHYQPQVAIASGTIVGVEALMRWRHPEHGWVSPAQFVPVAEDSGMIEPLGAWAMMEACRQAAAWQAQGRRLRMAVNVSARQFRSAGFVDAVARAMRLHNIDPAMLELELTESVLIETGDKAIATLEKLKRRGLRIAVDDFGTGYSSLSYLSGLPVDCLKIDRSFVVQTASGGRAAAIAQAIISLGRTLGLRVLAEGVETAEQLHFLREQGCDEGQGYFFARPEAPDALSALLGVSGGNGACSAPV